MGEPILGVLFDKDGTLFDFEATWNAWTVLMLRDLSGGDDVRAASLGTRIGFEFAERRFWPDSDVIAGTAVDIVRALAPGVPESSEDDLIAYLNTTAAQAIQVEAVPLPPLIARLRAMGLRLGVATNDSEAPAKAHLDAAGLRQSFDFVAGYDSGFGSKPNPGMCLGFASAMGLAPENVVMVGDSAHDLDAGRAAGMRGVAVLTGLADAEVLAPLATVVLPDIGHLPGWIEAQSA